MYTAQEREAILKQMVELFFNRDDILSVILVGSGAVGFKDEFSDLDLAVVVKDTDIDTIFRNAYEDIRCLGNVIVADFNPVRKLQLFLLDNYLEIDIGYYTLETLYARREHFKVIFDKTNLVESEMLNSWNEMKVKNKGTAEVVDMNKLIKMADDDLWYNVKHSVIAFKRDDKYRCYFELHEIRDKVIDLIAKRNNLESKRYRQVNLLPVEDRQKVDNMLIYPQNCEELVEMLLGMLKCLFEEFEYWDSKAEIKVCSDKVFLEKFIQENFCC